MTLLSKELCTLAKRVPKVVAKDEDERKRLEDQRTSLIAIIQMLHEDPELIQPTFMDLTAGKIKKPLSVGGPWPPAYNCIGKIPKYAKAMILVANSQGKLTKAIMNKIDSFDGDAINVLFNGALQTNDKTYVPPALRDKIAFIQVMLLRIRQLGNRDRGLAIAGALNQDTGEIDYVVAGPWMFEKDGEGKLVAYKFHGRDPRMVFAEPKAGYMLQYPMDVMSTQLVKGGDTTSLSYPFANGQGPKQFEIAPRTEPKKHPFQLLADRLKTMPAQEVPAAFEFDEKYLSESQEAHASSRKQKAQKRVQQNGANTPAAKRKKLIGVA